MAHETLSGSFFEDMASLNQPRTDFGRAPAAEGKEIKHRRLVDEVAAPPLPWLTHESVGASPPSALRLVARAAMDVNGSSKGAFAAWAAARLPRCALTATCQI